MAVAEDDIVGTAGKDVIGEILEADQVDVVCRMLNILSTMLIVSIALA